MTKPFSARGPVLTGTLTLALLVGTTLLWGLNTDIEGAIVAPGQIQVESNRQIVQHPDGGVVASIAVTEGQPVKAGDLLLTLDGSLFASELAIVEGQLFETRARRARLEAERDDAPTVTMPPDLADVAAIRADVADQVEGQLRLFEARRDTLARQTEQLARRTEQTAAQIDGIDAQSKALQTQLDLIRAELADQQALLEKGLAQSGRVLALEREQANLLGRSGELAAERAQAEGRITETDLEVLRLAAARREEASTLLRDIGSAEIELTERRRALLERIARLEVRAPVAGIVLGLAVTTPRAVIRPADPILYIVPQDRPLVIAARIAPIHVDEVHVGQSVRITLPAFSSRTTPELSGTLSLLSADALTDQATGQTYYRAEITLPLDQAAKLGDLTLLPGMPVDSFIRTGARTPMAYLLKPFTDYFAKAFRET
jgi:HlyD family secretion protein